MRCSADYLLVLDDQLGPMHRRLFRRMRALIEEGRWPAGARLPSSRQLADDLGISRNTTLHALEMLIADGWARSRPGSGIYVCATPAQPARSIESLVPRKPVPFETSRQTIEFFPVKRWNKLQSALPESVQSAALYGSDSMGWPPLRQAIARYLASSRGLACHPDQIIVVSGTQAALDLVSRAIGGQGREVWFENPGYHLASQLLKINGLVPAPIPVDAEGLDVDEGRRLAPRARLAYVTPACQFPTGRMMSAERRRALLAWAEERDATIIEDDWDWHANLAEGTPQPPLAAMPGGSERVLFIQTFNRTVFPAIRVAFVVAPRALASRFREMSMHISGAPSVPLQATLASFLDEGLYTAHLRATRTAYIERRQVLIEALDDLPRGFELYTDREGLQLIVRTPAELEDCRLAQAIRDRGMECSALSVFWKGNAKEQGLMLGFAAFTPDELRAAAAKLIEVLREYTPQNAILAT